MAMVAFCCLATKTTKTQLTACFRMEKINLTMVVVWFCCLARKKCNLPGGSVQQIPCYREKQAAMVVVAVAFHEKTAQST